ncbi:hypothetical protein [Bacillus thuringiensis]|uniref:hypothetical protein n=1 Tax=Bacillus thuringiensis TaxID=1428 RepID=UPI001482652D|nr:hypothetical protein [Bacillus thuringiensis]
MNEKANLVGSKFKKSCILTGLSKREQQLTTEDTFILPLMVMLCHVLCVEK